MGTPFGKWYEQKLGRIIPYYAVIPLITCFVWNCFVYRFTQFAYGGRQLHDLMTPFDEAVPFKTAWIIIYIAAYFFWIISYIEISRVNDREDFFRFVTADIFSRAVCGIIFLLFPTYNVRPEIVGNMLWDRLTDLIYKVDMPYNLFPSIHCLVSLFCFLGLMKTNRLNAFTKIMVLAGVLLIFASTQFTKQHYIVDVLGGALIALGSFWISHRWNIYKTPERLFNKINRSVFGRG